MKVYAVIDMPETEGERYASDVAAELQEQLAGPRVLKIAFLPGKPVFTQLQCVPVPNMSTTQCNVFMYGLDEMGQVWFKRDNDTKWSRVEMEVNDGVDDDGVS